MRTKALNSIFTLVALSSISAIAVAQTPQLDELSGTKFQLVSKSMEAAQLQLNIAQTNAQKARSDMQQLVMVIEAKYPGFTLNMNSGELMAKPQAQPAVQPEMKDPHTGKPLQPKK